MPVVKPCCTFFKLMTFIMFIFPHFGKKGSLVSADGNIKGMRVKIYIYITYTMVVNDKCVGKHQAQGSFSINTYIHVETIF